MESTNRYCVEPLTAMLIFFFVVVPHSLGIAVVVVSMSVELLFIVHRETSYNILS
jgi:hypothetical protein